MKKRILLFVMFILLIFIVGCVEKSPLTKEELKDLPNDDPALIMSEQKALTGQGYAQLTSQQKQAFWNCWKSECQSLLKEAQQTKDYSAYRQCSLGCFDEAQTSTENVWCEDSDGVDYFTKGTVTSNIYTNGKEDYCHTFPNGKTYLMEGKCVDNKYQYQQKSCGEIGDGYVCEEGKCVLKTDYIEVLVIDENEQPVAEANVELLTGVDYSLAEPLKAKNTNLDGKVFFNDPPANKDYVLKIKKQNYITTYTNNIWYGGGKEEFKKILTTYKEVWKNFNAEDLDPISTYLIKQPQLESDGRKIKLLHYPILNEEKFDDLETLDASLKIIAIENQFYPDQDQSYAIELIQNDIKVYEPNLFELELPIGAYWWLLSYTLHYKNGNQETHPLFTGNKEKDIAKATEKTIFGYEFIVLPKQEEPEYLELFPGHNNLNDEKRINLVFFNVDYGMEAFVKIVKGMLKKKFGLFEVEPLKSNLNKFNFWYVNQAVQDKNTLWTIKPYDLIHTEGTNLNSLSYDQKLRLGFGLPNLVPIYLTTGESGGVWGVNCWQTYSIKIYVGKPDLDNCLNYFSVEECTEKLRLDGVLTHELGHKLAGLGEEYKLKSFFNNHDFVETFHFNYNFGPWKYSYFSPYLNPTEDCVLETIGYNLDGYYYCRPNLGATDDCLQNAPWKDLMGNGCGQEGVIDCDENNANHKLEVTCDNAGGGYTKSADIMKPTKVSVMGEKEDIFDQICNVGDTNYLCDSSLNYQGRIYGQVNERQICEYLKTNTASVGGICTTEYGIN